MVIRNRHYLDHDETAHNYPTDWKMHHPAHPPSVAEAFAHYQSSLLLQQTVCSAKHHGRHCQYPLEAVMALLTHWKLDSAEVPSNLVESFLQGEPAEAPPA